MSKRRVEDFTDAERAIIRNQRFIMLALSCLLQNAGGMGSGAHASNLTIWVKQMDRAWEWIASPSERLE